MATLDEMKDAVTRTLEGNGVLGSIRAHLRAAIFTAIDQQEKKDGIHLENPRLKQLKNHQNGILLLALVEDFLQYYHLDFTRSCLHSEAELSAENLSGRRQLEQTLGVGSQPSREQPVLLELVRAWSDATHGHGHTHHGSPHGPSSYGDPLGQTVRSSRGAAQLGSPADYASDSFDESSELQQSAHHSKITSSEAPAQRQSPERRSTSQRGQEATEDSEDAAGDASPPAEELDAQLHALLGGVGVADRQQEQEEEEQGEEAKHSARPGKPQAGTPPEVPSRGSHSRKPQPQPLNEGRDDDEMSSSFERSSRSSDRQRPQQREGGEGGGGSSHRRSGTLLELPTATAPRPPAASEAEADKADALQQRGGVAQGDRSEAAGDGTRDETTNEGNRDDEPSYASDDFEEDVEEDIVEEEEVPDGDEFGLSLGDSRSFAQSEEGGEKQSWAGAGGATAAAATDSDAGASKGDRRAVPEDARPRKAGSQGGLLEDSEVEEVEGGDGLSEDYDVVENL